MKYILDIVRTIRICVWKHKMKQVTVSLMNLRLFRHFGKKQGSMEKIGIEQLKKEVNSLVIELNNW